MNYINANVAGIPFAISEVEARYQFLDYIRQSIFFAPETIKAEGVIQRFSTNGKKDDKAGWCVFYGTAGAFGDWRTGESYRWHAERYQRLPKAEQKRIQRQLENIKKEQQEERDVECERIAQQARDDIECFDFATPNHPYLLEKGIQPHGTLVDFHNALIIPMYWRREIVSYQRIFPKRLPDGTNKRFLKGGRKKDCYYPIADTGTGDLLICEGFATGASLHECTGHAVIVAFDAGNLLPVSSFMRERYPTRKIILCADDDYRTEGNPGLTKAKAAADAINAYLAIPHFGENRPEGATDFNDLHQLMKGGQSCFKC